MSFSCSDPVSVSGMTKIYEELIIFDWILYLDLKIRNQASSTNKASKFDGNPVGSLIKLPVVGQ